MTSLNVGVERDVNNWFSWARTSRPQHPVKGRMDDLSDERNLALRFKKEVAVPQKLNMDYHTTQQLLSEVYVQQN